MGLVRLLSHVVFLFKFYFIYFTHMGVLPANKSVLQHTCNARRGQKTASDPPERLQMVRSHMGAGTQCLTFQKSSQCSELLSHLSSPCCISWSSFPAPLPLPLPLGCFFSVCHVCSSTILLFSPPFLRTLLPLTIPFTVSYVPTHKKIKIKDRNMRC